MMAANKPGSSAMDRRFEQTLASMGVNYGGPVAAVHQHVTLHSEYHGQRDPEHHAAVAGRRLVKTLRGRGAGIKAN